MQWLCSSQIFVELSRISAFSSEESHISGNLSLYKCASGSKFSGCAASGSSCSGCVALGSSCSGCAASGFTSHPLLFHHFLYYISLHLDPNAVAVLHQDPHTVAVLHQDSHVVAVLHLDPQLLRTAQGRSMSDSDLETKYVLLI